MVSDYMSFKWTLLWWGRFHEKLKDSKLHIQIAFRQTPNSNSLLPYLSHKYLIASKVPFPVDEITFNISLKVLVQSDPKLPATDKGAN